MPAVPKNLSPDLYKFHKQAQMPENGLHTVNRSLQGIHKSQVLQMQHHPESLEIFSRDVRCYKKPFYYFACFINLESAPDLTEYFLFVLDVC